MTFSVYMVRHGQTQLNKYRRMQGWCDSPLTAKGIADAHKAGRHLAQINFDRVYHSDMTRTARTCKIIMDENQATPQFDTPTALHYFREQCYGYFEGQDSANTWIMVGMPHGCKTFEELITKFSLEKSRDMMKAVDRFTIAKATPSFGNASMPALTCSGKTTMMATASCSSVTERASGVLCTGTPRKSTLLRNAR